MTDTGPVERTERALPMLETVKSPAGSAIHLGRYPEPVVNSDQSPSDLVSASRELGETLSRTASDRDREGRLPRAELEEVRKAGLTAIRVPRPYGGPHLSYTDTAKVMIHLAKGDPSVAQVLLPHTTTIERIRLMATEDQRQLYLGAVRHGAIISGATTERVSTIRTDMATRLVRDGEGYRLTGTKFYSTGGLMADLLRVTARHDDGHTVSVLLPRDRAGIHQEDDWRSMGQKGTASGTTRFEDVAVSEDEIIPFDAREGSTRNYQASGTQVLHSTIEVGIALNVLDDAARFVREKARVLPDSGVTRAGDDPYVLHTIGDIAARAHTARASLLWAAGCVDEAHDLWHEGWLTGKHPWERVEQTLAEASVAVAEAKIVCNEAALRSADLLFEVGGASATLSTNNFDRHWRNARTHTTHDATPYKYKIVGNYYTNGTLPPITMYY
ncbi:acyl-CoA dehydrogenase family protein [Terrihabitans sp. B22-R8]|uniref:acyl-CoA dehydrogenase family protein n=1 Tax=Terrihabitans sp. B22-R8 TaxID=3425128 RepID=UPI00403C66D5